MPSPLYTYLGAVKKVAFVVLTNRGVYCDKLGCRSKGVFFFTAILGKKVLIEKPLIQGCLLEPK